MALELIEISLLKLPYVHFFETSFGRAYDRTFSIIRVSEGGIDGYGECVAEEAPLYSGETTETAWHVLGDFLIPLVFSKEIYSKYSVIPVHDRCASEKTKKCSEKGRFDASVRYADLG